MNEVIIKYDSEIENILNALGYHEVPAKSVTHKKWYSKNQSGRGANYVKFEHATDWTFWICGMRQDLYSAIHLPCCLEDICISFALLALHHRTQYSLRMSPQILVRIAMGLDNNLFLSPDELKFKAEYQIVKELLMELVNGN